jgi:hypothetical protein
MTYLRRYGDEVQPEARFYETRKRLGVGTVRRPSDWMKHRRSDK